MHMMRKGLVKTLDRHGAVGQAKFVESLFQIAAPGNTLYGFSRLKILFAIEPSGVLDVTGLRH